MIRKDGITEGPEMNLITSKIVAANTELVDYLYTLGQTYRLRQEDMIDAETREECLKIARATAADLYSTTSYMSHLEEVISKLHIELRSSEKAFRRDQEIKERKDRKERALLAR